MFAQIIKQEIERATATILEHSRFVQAAQQGLLKKEDVVRYLKNCLFVVRHTPIHLTQARETAESQGLNEVARFMANKWIEEKGHDAWAIADLDSLNASPIVLIGEDITQANQRLMEFVGTLAIQQPLNYIAYITFVEYFTVLAAPPFLLSLERSGIPRSSLSVIALHEELDKEHVAEDLTVIAGLVESPEQQGRFLEVLLKTEELLNEHFNELAEDL